MSADPGPRLSTEWSLAGQPAVLLENRAVRVVVLPGLGGKVISLVDKAADVELLWRNRRVPLRPVPVGTGYDDHFAGGWDELYPNDEPEVVAGEPLPDHGELWTTPWAWRAGSDDAGAWVELDVVGPVTGTRATKRLVLGHTSRIEVGYTLTNPGRVDQPFLWKSHVAVALQPDTVADMAAGTVLVHEFGQPRARPAGGSFRWPFLEVDGTRHDVRTRPDTTSRGVSEFLIATELTRGECSVRHAAAGTGLRLTWDRADLPSCWLFASHGGGWRGLDVLVLEPCTGHPLSLVDGVAAGTHQVLTAGSSRTWRLDLEVGQR